MQVIKTTFFVFLILMLANPLRGNAQNENTGFLLSSKGHYGFIIAHRGNMGNLIKGHTRMLEMVYSKPTYGNKAWQQIYHYPSLGVSFLYADLANPKQLGNVTAVFPHINFGLIRAKHFKLNLRVGHGLGYFEKTFNTYDNYKNNAISSHLNPMVNFQLESQLKFSNRISMENGIAVTHFSNGAYKIPNLGLNILTVNTGFTYQFGPADRVFKRENIPLPRRHMEISLMVNGALKEILPIGGPKYAIYSLIGTIEKQLDYKNKVGLGLDLFYNSSLFPKLIRDSINISTNASILQSGLNLSYGLTIHRITILVSMGAYIHSKYKGDGYLYHRIGTRYRINNFLILNATLKTHFAVADHWELGIGYLLKR